MNDVNQNNQVAAEADLNNDNNITQVKQVAAEVDSSFVKAAEVKACTMPEGYENWKRFPCSSKKRPLVKDWQNVATNDAQQLAAWEVTFPDCMWGAPTGTVNGFWVLDLDRGHAEGVDGVESLKNYCKEHGYKIPETLVAKTAGGGLHLYYKMSEGIDIRNAAGILPGVDVRGNGGFTIVPPSVNQDTGGSYRWLNPLQPIMEASDWLLDLVTKKKKEKPDPPEASAEISEPIEGGGTPYGNAALSKEVEKMRKAEEGKRNDTLNAAAFNLYGLVKGNELEKDVVDRELEAAALETGLPEDEILKTMGSAWNAAEPRTAPDRNTVMGAADDGPIPLRRPPQPQQSYPVEAFGEFEPTVVDIANHTSTPQSMVGGTVLSAFSLVAMRLVNAKVPQYPPTPLSLYFSTIGESGDGKDNEEGVVFKPIKDYQRALLEGHHDVTLEFDRKRKAHEREKKLLEREKLNKEEYLEKLKKLDGDEPIAPIEPVFLTGDPNIEGIYRLFRDGFPFLGVFTDEGAQLFGGTAFSKDNDKKTIANLSSIWSGKEWSKVRQGEGASILYDRRLCMHIMVQPDVIREVLENKLYTNQGFLCRFLYSWPVSMAHPVRHEDIEQYESVQKFWRRCEQLLKLEYRQTKDGGLILDNLEPSDDAQKAYDDYHDYVDTRTLENGEYEPVRGFARRAAENALRIAGCLSMARNHESRVIDRETMEAGIKLADWYLNEILRITLDGMASPEILKAEKLLEWFRKKGIKATSGRQILQFGPNEFREASKVKAVFKTLINHQWLVQIDGGAEVWMGDGKTSFSREAWMVQDDIAA